MSKETYIDLEIIAAGKDEYIVRVDKSALNSLVLFSDLLTVRHWDGNKPVVLEPYGQTAVRTKEDAKATNNLENVPNVDVDELLSWLTG